MTASSTEIRYKMDALPNADTRRGGKNPSCAGLTSCTSPEVQGLKTRNSHTGVSSDYVPNGNKPSVTAFLLKYYTDKTNRYAIY